MSASLASATHRRSLAWTSKSRSESVPNARSGAKTNRPMNPMVHTVGIPAKSGIGGGLMAVAPGKVGVAVYSPRLDNSGNSVRGMKVCRDLALMLGLHLFQSGSWPTSGCAPGATGATSVSGAAVPSAAH